MSALHTLAGRPLICFDAYAGSRVKHRDYAFQSLRDEIMQFHDRKPTFLAGPEGIVELAQWLKH